MCTRLQLVFFLKKKGVGRGFVKSHYICSKPLLSALQPDLYDEDGLVKWALARGYQTPNELDKTIYYHKSQDILFITF